jgi:hypothetical protein
MGQFSKDSAQHLLQISTDLHNRMAEIQKLKELVRSAEAAKHDRQPTRPAVIAQPDGTELRA